MWVLMGKKSSNPVVTVHRLQLACLIAFAPASLTGKGQRSISDLFFPVTNSSIIRITGINSFVLNLKPSAERWREQGSMQLPTVTRLIGYWSRLSVTGRMGIKTRRRRVARKRLRSKLYV